MAEEVKLGVEIDAEVNGSADAKQLADTVADISSALRDLVTAAKTAASGLDKVEKGAAGVTKATSTAVKAVQNLGDAQKEINKSIGLTTPKVGQPYSPLAIRHEQELKASIDATNTARAKAIELEQRQIQQAKRMATIPSAAGRKADYSLGAGNAELAIGASFGEINREAGKAADNLQNVRDQLFTARFALHDVSNAFALTGGALVAFNALTIKTAADYEQAFAQIRRTTGATEADMVGIREQFIGLAQDIPVAFSELAKIGTLAGQLNIATDNLERFTKTTAMFASTTDVTVEAAATAFGRLDTLLPDVKGNYDALGSSILNVGINSVATESEIISTTNQIAAAGAQAGFTADEVIGLAASFASLGVAPESARGTTIRVLSEIRSAVLEGGEALDTFAKLSGQSADSFKQAWSQDAAGAFMSVLEGLNKEGAMAEVTLRGLGITAVRDIRALLALSQNVEVVGQNFGYAAQGFEDGTQLADSFAITSETLASRLQVLGQSLEALVATLGESGTGPLKDFVNGLNELVKWITELAKSPFAQWAFVAVGLFTALAGGALLVASALTRMGAAAVAAKTITVELQAMSASMVAAGVSANSLQMRALGAAQSMLTLRGALLAIGTATGIGIAIAGVTAAVTMIGDAMKTSSDKAKEAFGDFSALSDALQKDTAAAREGAEVYGTIEGTVKRTSESTASWVGAVESATGGQVRLSDATSQTTDIIREQTFAIGENTAKIVANNLANNQAVQQSITNMQELNKFAEALGVNPLDTGSVLKTAISGDFDEARRQLQEFQVELNRAGGSMQNMQVAGTGLNDTIDLIEGSLQQASSQLEVTNAVNEAFGISTSTAVDGLTAEGDAAETAANQMSVLKSSIESAFSVQNAISAFAQDFYTLAESIATGGATMNAFSQEGQANLANLQSSIATAIAAGEAMGLSATESVAVLFRQLQQMGIDTAQLLASLANVGLPGVSIGGVGAYLNGTKAMTSTSQQLSKALSEINSNAKQAATSIGGGGGGVGGAAKEAAQEIRTLVDYANDLGGVFQRAFDIRFGGGQALDKIAKGWNDIAKATKEANDAIKESYVTLKQLTSDKAIAEYFLGVAQQYGDSLRAGDISGDLAEINQKIAEEQGKIATAQEKTNKTLVGNSSAAIENRATLLGLVGSYQDLLEQYAASGMSQADLEKKSIELRQEFIKQATQMGFNRKDVEKYGLAFQDFTKIIKQVPRNITVSANIDPAKQALNEFVSRTKKAMSDARGAVGGGVRIPMTYSVDYSGLANQIRAEIRALETRLDAAYAENNGNGSGKTAGLANAIAKLRAGLAQLGFQSGGYTGNTATSNVAGVVHGQEYVINAQNTSRLGLPFLNALNSGRTPATPGNNIMVVELSAYDRMLLAKAGDVQLSISGDKIAAVTNASNLVAAKRGTN